VTFDAFGVSGHANHRATFDGVALLARRLRDHRTALRAIENVDPDGADHGAGSAGRRGGHANVPGATARATNGPGDGADAAWQSQCHKVDACYALETVGLARKYIGVFDVIVSCLLQRRYWGRRSCSNTRTSVRSVPAHAGRRQRNGDNGSDDGNAVGGGALGDARADADAPARVQTSLDMTLAFRVMAAHWSQLVWYRVLFVIFSRYSYVNTLVRI
jgi:hypothetical protein